MTYIHQCPRCHVVHEENGIGARWCRAHRGDELRYGAWLAEHRTDPDSGLQYEQNRHRWECAGCKKCEPATPKNTTPGHTTTTTTAFPPHARQRKEN